MDIKDSNSVKTNMNNNQKRSPKIRKAVLIYMVPFYIKRNFIELESQVWEGAKMSMEKGILYSHIQRFMGASVMGENQTLEPHDYRIYSLKSPKEENPQDIILRSIKRMLSCIYRVENNDTYHTIPFKFSTQNKTFLSPKLVICPNAKTGILMFSIEPAVDVPISMSVLQSLNYILFKSYNETSTEAKAIVLKSYAEIQDLWQQYKELMKPENDLKAEKIKQENNLGKTNNEKKKAGIEKAIKRIDEQILALNTEERSKQLEIIEKEIKDALDNEAGVINAIDIALSRPKTNVGNIEGLMSHHWIIRDFVNCLMSDFSHQLIERADNNRMHMFAYVQMDKTNDPDRELLEFSRLVRCQDKDYMVIPTSGGKPICQQLYENIYVGSSVEGGGVLTILQGPGNDFLKNFHTGPLTKSYLWIYLLALMQRHTLLQMSRELAEEYGYSGKTTDEQLKNLRELMIDMSKTKINTYFTDVSDHSHLNALYQFCCANLAVDRYFVDVDNKLATLKETLEQLHDEKMRLIQEKSLELEKESEKREKDNDKKQRMREKTEDRRQQNITKWIGVAAVVLTLFSALSDSYDLFSADKLNWIPQALPSFELVSSTEFVSSICHLLLLLGAFSIVGAITWKIIDVVQKHNKEDK